MRGVILAGLLTGLSTCSPAYAQVECGPADAVATELSETYGEASRGYGLWGAVVIEIIVNAETGTWTVVTHRPDGLTCVVAHGTDWTEPARAEGDRRG